MSDEEFDKFLNETACNLASLKLVRVYLWNSIIASLEEAEAEAEAEQDEA